jgi:hypothetical protein
VMVENLMQCVAAGLRGQAARSRSEGRVGGGGALLEGVLDWVLQRQLDHLVESRLCWSLGPRTTSDQRQQRPRK